MKPKHTPGPWQVTDSGFIGTTEEDFQTIGYLSDRRNRKQRSKKETNANGKLIAGAPELLAAAVALVECLEFSKNQFDALDKLKKAIKKAS